MEFSFNDTRESYYPISSIDVSLGPNCFCNDVTEYDTVCVYGCQ